MLAASADPAILLVPLLACLPCRLHDGEGERVLTQVPSGIAKVGPKEEDPREA